MLQHLHEPFYTLGTDTTATAEGVILLGSAFTELGGEERKEGRADKDRTVYFECDHWGVLVIDKVPLRIAPSD